MVAREPGASEFLPAERTFDALRDAIQQCRGCSLFKNATQAVFGDGTQRAKLMLIGEQPGHQEDRRGSPFVGPAGQLLRTMLREARIAEQSVYMTNAVKHFKWKPQGKRRLHAKPAAREMAACRPWLEEEIRLVAPPVIVCLGATASQSLLGSDFRLTQQRGKPLETAWADWLICTYHPSAVLRTPDASMRTEMRRMLQADLKLAARLLSD